MEANGLLSQRKGGKHPPARQLYRITPQGRALLRALKREMTELYREVVLDEGTNKSSRRRER
jgi:DNA-binding PadR family transcriptional regulator